MKRAQKMAKNDYQGARGTHFALFPASAVAKSTPQWVMSTELVETSRLVGAIFRPDRSCLG